MPEPALLYETKENGRIVVMTLNRPEKLNALNLELSNALADAWERFAQDEDAWVAILTGAGDRAFCAGLDLRERAEQNEAGTVQQVRRKPTDYLSERFNLWKPTIAAINGFAVAGGWSLAQQCDIRIASEEAEMGITEARWNMGAPWLSTLTRQLQLGHALEIALWGDKRITAQRAYEIGWINKVVPKEQLMDEAMDWAQRMLALAPRAVRNFKEILYRSYSMTPEQGRAFTASLEFNLAGMEDSVEGPKAFTERRPPVFKNK